jgi:hypothetical protein
MKPLPFADPEEDRKAFDARMIAKAAATVKGNVGTSPPRG